MSSTFTLFIRFFPTNNKEAETDCLILQFLSASLDDLPMIN